MAFRSAAAVEKRIREIFAERGVTHTPFTVHQSSGGIVWLTWFDPQGQAKREKVGYVTLSGAVQNCTVGYLREADLQATVDRLCAE